VRASVNRAPHGAFGPPDRGENELLNQRIIVIAVHGEVLFDERQIERQRRAVQLSHFKPDRR
jgi:hypothetical protein